MKYYTPLRPFLILAIIISAAEASFSLNELQEPLKEGIEWRDCNIVGPLNASCGHFEVPLDWNDPSAGKGRLAVIKYHATRPAAERKGVLFTHPGGAAGDAMGWLIARSEVMMNLLVNGTYDLISWDIRGTPTRNEHIMLHEYSTIPSAPRCFSDQAVPNQLWESIYNMKVPTSNITFSHPEQASLYSITYRLYEYRRLFAKSCTLNSREEYSPMLKYMGTAATTRDLVALADYLQGPGTPINFHGVSKGSLIGSHLINMFPERVGHVILDRPANPRNHIMDWIHAVANANQTFHQFTELCRTRPEQCSVLTSKKGGVREYTRDALAMTRAGLVGLDAIFGHDLINNVALKTMVEAIHNATEGPELQYYDWVKTLSDTTRYLRRLDDGDTAIYCSDYSSEFEEYPEGDHKHMAAIEWYTRISKDSPLLGTLSPANQYLCNLWPERAVERYQGPWNRKPANPVLVVANTLNPLDGFAQAESIAREMGDNAYLVKEEGFAFSFFPHTQHANKIMTTYLLNDTLPGESRVKHSCAKLLRLLGKQNGVFLLMTGLLTSLSLLVAIFAHRCITNRKKKHTDSEVIPFASQQAKGDAVKEGLTV